MVCSSLPKRDSILNPGTPISRQHLPLPQQKIANMVFDLLPSLHQVLPIGNQCPPLPHFALRHRHQLQFVSRRQLCQLHGIDDESKLTVGKLTMSENLPCRKTYHCREFRSVI